jgi:hypothetical protein
MVWSRMQEFVPLLATCQRPDSTNLYAAIQHRPSHASGEAVERRAENGPQIGLNRACTRQDHSLRRALGATLDDKRHCQYDNREYRQQ